MRKSNAKSVTEDLTVGVETTVEAMTEVSIETTVDVETTAEAMTEAIKVETDKVGVSKETTGAVEMTEARVTGIVQNATTQTLHSEPNAIDVENLKVQAAAITIGTVMTAEAMTEAIKVETDKAADLKETTVDAEMTAVLEIGTVQSATTQTLHSEPNAIAVANHVALVAETAVDAVMTAEAMTEVIKIEIAKVDASREMTVDEAETIVEVVEKLTTIMIGTAQSVTTQTLHSERNVTVVVNLVQVAVDGDNVETMEEDLLDVMTVREHLAEKAETDPLDVKMVEDHPAVMAATEEMKAAMRTEAHTVKNGQNAGQRNLELLGNLVAMGQVMHITDLQNQSVAVEMTTREGQKWVPNITTSMP